MYLVENPVLQRELLVNLRMARGFALLFVYQLLLGTLVFLAWPQQSRLDLSENPQDARWLVDTFFLGQYLLACVMSPSFAGGAITGEKERMTYEMLLASPLRPTAIVLGKLLASLAHLAVLIFASLPVIVLCLPLGGYSIFEVLAAYTGLILSVLTFGVISLACSSYFRRTSAALVVSYLVILPLALLAVLSWFALASQGWLRFLLTVSVFPVLCCAICLVLIRNTARRLLHPPDVGSEGQEVVDLAREAEEAFGLVIQPDQFPDRLFAPAKRDTLMEDGINPVYDKEIRSEIFSQGTLMLRVVIQVSIVLALPLMGYCLFIEPQNAPWYIAYVLLFNMLVGPVFSAGSVTSERERQTLDLLLTTMITPGQILWGKLLAGLRVSSVLTLMLLWPLILAAVLVSDYWPNWTIVAAYAAAVMLTCLTTAAWALFCSVLFRKSSQSLLASYLIILVLFGAPLVVSFFAQRFFADAPGTAMVEWLGISSPFAATFALPLQLQPLEPLASPRPANWPLVAGFAAFTLAVDTTILALMAWLFQWRKWEILNSKF